MSILLTNDECKKQKVKLKKLACKQKQASRVNAKNKTGLNN